MRLSLATDLESREGQLDKDALLTNSFVDGELGVCKRPGSTDLGLIEAGIAQLLACWNGTLSVIGDSLASLILTIVPTSYVGDGEDFDLSTLGDYTQDVQAIRYINGVFLAGAMENSIPDGRLISVVWDGGSTTITDVTNPSTRTATIPIAMAASPTRLVIAGNNDLIGSGNAGELYSAPLSIPYTLTLRDSSAVFTAKQVKYANATFVAVLTDFTDSRIRYSTDDGTTWTSRSIAGVWLLDCCFDGTAWWFVGGNGSVPVLYSSTDLVTFTSHTPSGLGSSSHFTQIVYLDLHGYFATCYDGTQPVYRSLDGLSWVLLESPPYAWLSISDEGVYVRWVNPSTLTEELLKFDTGTNLLNLLIDTPSFVGSGLQVSADGILFATFGDTGVGAIGSAFDVSEIPSATSVTPTPIDDLSPVTPNLDLFAQSNGAAQSQQQLFIKSREQAWIYTR